MNVKINCRFPSQVGRIISEFVLPASDSFTVEANGHRGGWTISFLTDRPIAFWRTVAMGLYLDFDAVEGEPQEEQL